MTEEDLMWIRHTTYLQSCQIDKDKAPNRQILEKKIVKIVKSVRENHKKIVTRKKKHEVTVQTSGYPFETKRNMKTIYLRQLLFTKYLAKTRSEPIWNYWYVSSYIHNWSLQSFSWEIKALTYIHNWSLQSFS